MTNTQSPAPVAWRRQEAGNWVYYETKAWDDLEPLYTAPPLPAQVQEAEGDVVQMLIAALDNIDATACCDHPMGMNDSRRRYAIARDARIAIARARAALASRTPAPGMAGGVGAEQ